MNLFIIIYIYSRPKTFCFVVTQLFSVTRPFKAKSKPGWYDVSWLSYLRAIVNLKVNEEIFAYIFLLMRYRQLQYLFHEKSIAFQRIYKYMKLIQIILPIHQCIWS